MCECVCEVGVCTCVDVQWTSGLQKCTLYNFLSHIMSHDYQLGLQKQMCKESLRYKMFIRNQLLWREGKGGRTGQGRIELHQRSSRALANRQKLWSECGPSRWLGRAEMAQPLFTHLAQWPDLGHPGRGITSKETALQLGQSPKELTVRGCLLSTVPSEGHLVLPWRGSGWCVSMSTKFRVKA